MHRGHRPGAECASLPVPHAGACSAHRQIPLSCHRVFRLLRTWGLLRPNALTILISTSCGDEGGLGAQPSPRPVPGSCAHTPGGVAPGPQVVRGEHPAPSCSSLHTPLAGVLASCLGVLTDTISAPDCWLPAAWCHPHPFTPVSASHPPTAKCRPRLWRVPRLPLGTGPPSSPLQYVVPEPEVSSKPQPLTITQLSLPFMMPKDMDFHVSPRPCYPMFSPRFPPSFRFQETPGHDKPSAADHSERSGCFCKGGARACAEPALPVKLLRQGQERPGGDTTLINGGQNGCGASARDTR